MGVDEGLSRREVDSHSVQDRAARAAASSSDAKRRKRSTRAGTATWLSATRGKRLLIFVLLRS
jgi:hypothetical protein